MGFEWWQACACHPDHHHDAHANYVPAGQLSGTGRVGPTAASGDTQAGAAPAME